MSLKLKKVRLSFPDLFEPTQYEGKGAFRYNATFLIVPGSENDNAIRAAIQEVGLAKFGKKWPAMWESIKGNSNKCCYMNGNTKDYEGYEGMWFLSAHRKQESGRPLIIDGNKTPLTIADGKPYAGCYTNASVDIYAMDGQNSGIRCGLLGVQFHSDGDAFSGAGVAKPDDFESIEEGALAEDLV